MMMPSIFGNNFVDDVFDDMFPFAGNYTTANYDLMKTDVKDAGDHYELEMEMPGVEKENIKYNIYKIISKNTRHHHKSFLPSNKILNNGFLNNQF